MDYEVFFHLKERPFKNPLESRFFYRTKTVNSLCQTLTEKPPPELVLLKGPAGTGKSTILRLLQSNLNDESLVTPIFNSSFQLAEILRETLTSFGLGYKCHPETPEEALLGFFQNAVSQFVAEGHNYILAIDDAHSLKKDVLGDLWALTRLESTWLGHTCLVLSGRDSGEWPKLPATAPEPKILETGPLDLVATMEYVQHRMTMAGADREYFTPEALGTLYEYSHGLPETINLMAERALMTAWAAGRKEITVLHLSQAKTSLEKPMKINPVAAKAAAGYGRKHHRIRKRPWVPLITVFVLICGLFYLTWPNTQAPVKNTPATPEATVETQAPETSTPAAEAVLPEEASGLSLPTPPPNLLTLPHNTLALVVDQSLNMARLWQGGLKGPGLKAEIMAPDFPEPGLYLVGRPQSRTSLIFQYPPAKKIPTQAGEKLWKQMESLLPQDILPLIVGDSKLLAHTVPDNIGDLLKTKLKTWTQGQEFLFPDTVAFLYADSFQFFEPGKAPQIITREKFRAALDSESKSSGSVTLTSSEPLILLDPRDHNRAWAIFNLKYDSKLRHDVGIRTIIFEKNRLNDDWFIVAELWLKENSLKNR